jgi:tetratricopeptide (TPR) repeat protein
MYKKYRHVVCFRLHMTAVLTAAALLAFTLLPSPAVGGACEEWTAKVVSVQGIVEARAVGGAEWESVSLDDTFCPGDVLRVQTRSRSAVVLSSGATLRLDQESTVTFTSGKRGQPSLIDLLSGTVYFFSRLRRSLKVTTPFVNAGVEGTEFLVRVEEGRTFLSVFTGRVNLTNDAGSLSLVDGQSATTASGQGPALTGVVKPRDAVTWALYYPPILKGPSAGGTQSGGAGADRLTAQAAQLLGVGRVDEARSEIEKALALAPGDTRALSLLSIISVTRNDAAEALRIAAEAVNEDPGSATAHLALSYARQALFDLEGARESLLAAVEQEPESALAWARLAEIHLSFGDIEKALAAAAEATSLAPDLERTRTVLGFAHLAAFDTNEAKQVFKAAIKLDQVAPLPRLGLGLAMIRKGDLEGGRSQIEIAVSLDPDRSLLRSYLGKAFHEEKSGRLATRQYTIARQLDPRDPTPLFYAAIHKQTVNRPVEALWDLQQSIALNDNRAVYRSRLLLDSDLAARSASLARIYQDLGFEQLALVEGWKSLDADPGNFSAHRFLADTYATLPRHEIARVSELLQSQLRQPINITPVQPRLAEGNISILEGAGPSELSFNEFNPLFQRNRLTLQANGVAGSNDTLGGEAVVAGIHDKISYSLGGFHYETDGYRENNDLKQDIFNAFAQLSLSHRTSLQAELRYTDSERGDLPLRADPDAFFVDERGDEQTESVRLGLRHVFSPRSDLLASFQYVSGDETVVLFPGDVIGVKDNGYLGELQHFFRSERFLVTSGAGYLDADREESITLGDFPFEDSKMDFSHANIYLYPQLEYPDTVTWTVGLSADFLSGIEVERDQINPKAGLVWTPCASTTLRAAAFRTLNRTLLSSQTLEPTQVAGFNQFFDDGEGTDARRYGLGIDQRFSESLYAGAEISRRDMDVPYTLLAPPPAPPESAKADWREDFGRGYLYWTPHPWLSTSAEVQYEKLERDEEFVGPELFTEIDTWRLPLAVRFFHPSGLFAKLQSTYVDQEGTFSDPFSGELTQTGDSFWVVDAALGYRLPKRLGIISLEAGNLLDEQFGFQDTDPSHPRISPERIVAARITLSF